ncbi:hypothetical protein I4U23_006409 [Adineta vaga]|nr:hypothetical protein I4U23_006409 [Adineta vaga]
MSDTSVVSDRYSHDRYRRRRHSPSFCDRYWFHLTATLLLILILIIGCILGYVLYKQWKRDQQRRRIKSDFKQKHGVASKVLDLVSNDGIIGKWMKKFNGQILSIFRQLIADMVETIFE